MFYFIVPYVCLVRVVRVLFHFFIIAIYIGRILKLLCLILTCCLYSYNLNIENRYNFTLFSFGLTKSSTATRNRLPIKLTVPENDVVVIALQSDFVYIHRE